MLKTICFSEFVFMLLIRISDNIKANRITFGASIHYAHLAKENMQQKQKCNMFQRKKTIILNLVRPLYLRNCKTPWKVVADDIVALSNHVTTIMRSSPDLLS